MKHFLSLAVAVLLATIALAQNPAVSITVDDVQGTSFTCSFSMNENCTSYTICSGVVNDFEQWFPMFGIDNVLPLIISWGINYTEDATYTWREMTPNTDYVVYVACFSADDTLLITDTLHTRALGGEGISQLTITVTEIGDTNARVIVTPNDQTAEFRDGIVSAELFNEVGRDSIIAIIQESPYVYYETDDWNWLTLDPGTQYYALAIGINGIGEWGELAMEQFTTTGTRVGIGKQEKVAIEVYPNPATEIINISGLTEQSCVELFDMQGRKVMQTIADNKAQLNISKLAAGNYIVVVNSRKGTIPSSFPVTIK